MIRAAAVPVTSRRPVPQTAPARTARRHCTPTARTLPASYHNYGFAAGRRRSMRHAGAAPVRSYIGADSCMSWGRPVIGAPIISPSTGATPPRRTGRCTFSALVCENPRAVAEGSFRYAFECGSASTPAARSVASGLPSPLLRDLKHPRLPDRRDSLGQPLRVGVRHTPRCGAVAVHQATRDLFGFGGGLALPPPGIRPAALALTQQPAGTGRGW